MSVAAHHAEWLALVPASGPFLSLPVLSQVFPQGLEAPDTEFCAQMRVAHQEWGEQHHDPAFRRAWFDFIRRGLGWPPSYWREGQDVPAALKLGLPQYGETLRPDAVLMAPDATKARLLWNAYLPDQGLEKALVTRGWNASPATRMAELLRASGVALGLVSNGEEWMLVHAAPGQETSYVSFNATLWNEERLCWRAFVSLLGGKRFFALGDDEQLEILFEKSLENQQEVTDQLGLQVRRALELLVSTFEREDQNTRGYLLRERTAREIYEAALCVMMRLVFLFCAEERGMLPLGNPFYARNYAVSTLRAELRERADAWSEETLERGFDAWCRLLSTFRVVYGGIEHGECPMIPYGGGLFDPNKFAWLEGRDAGSDWEHILAEPLPVDNRTVLHLLEALQILRTNVPGIGVTARVVSFAALDIEQIGHVYEGLLDHTARRAQTTMVSLRGGGGQEPEIALETLEQWREGGTLAAQVAKQTGRSKSAVQKDLESGALELIGRLNRVCGEESLVERVLPFANLIRIDAFDLPVVIRPNALFVTREGDRRATGTHYTPRSLTEPLVAKSLDPLLYRGFSDGVGASRESLKSAREILDLKVCDPACGSGGVLVQACRYLSEKLLESWEIAEATHFSTQVESQRVAPIAPNSFERTSDSSATDGESASRAIESRGDGGSNGNTQISGESNVAPMNSALSANKFADFRPASKNEAQLFLPYAEPVALQSNARPLPDNPDERALEARRLVADRCIYGVDSDHLAIEMAQLSLWLITMATDRPFSFLEHALRVGDSLAGVDLAQLRTQSLDRREGNSSLTRVQFSRAVNEARTAREAIHGAGEDEEAKRQLLRESQRRVEELCQLANTIVAPSFAPIKPAERAARRIRYWKTYLSGGFLGDTVRPQLRAEMDADLNGIRPFHWPLEFPDAFFRDSYASEREAAGTPQNGGFDAIVGNPPFMGGQRITGNLGVPYRDYLIESLARGTKGSADLVAYFYLRAFDLIRHGGTFGLIATNTIAQGDTREVGLDQICASADAGNSANDSGGHLNDSGNSANDSGGHQNDSGDSTNDSGSHQNDAGDSANDSGGRPDGSGGATNDSGSSTSDSGGAAKGSATRLTPLALHAPEAQGARGGTIYAANPSQKWPGTASLEVALVHVRRGAWGARFDLAGETVSGITPYLAEPGAVAGNPHRLAANAGLSFQGSIVLGMGFVLEPEAAQQLMARDPKNAEVLQPYLNGEDLNSRPDSSPSRWVINFRDWPLDRESAPPTYAGPVAADYPDCLEIVERLVKPEREKQNRESRKKRWWQFAERAAGLYQTIKDLPRVLVAGRVSKYVVHKWCEPNFVYDVATNVFTDNRDSTFAMLTSSIYDVWAWKNASTLETRIRYTNGDCFETFAFPVLSGEQRGALTSLGRSYGARRRGVCEARGLGLTKVYNLFHDAQTEGDETLGAQSGPFDDIRALRALHREIDELVARAYGWDDLALNHDFHPTPQGTRYTLGPDARREVLDRLLALNHQRYAREVAGGAHDKKAKKHKGGQMGLGL